MAMNNVVLLGRLTATPELKQTASGTTVTQFTVAVDRDTTNADGTRSADFISCVAWKQTAEFISRYFDKGRMIAVMGTLRTRTYDDKNGTKHYVTEVYVNKVSFTGEKKDDGNYQPQQNYNGGNYQPQQQQPQQSRPNNNGYYQQPQQQPQHNSSVIMDEYEEIISDSDLPF